MSQSPSDEETSMEDVQCTENLLICQPLQNIVNALKYYQTVDIDTNLSEFVEYFEKYQHEIVNDYHHILSHHNNRDKQTLQESNDSFESIYQLIIKHVQCEDIYECCIYIRSNRNRDSYDHPIAKDESLLFYIDLMDTIHCYFLHSYDSGYRFIPPNTTNADADADADDISLLLSDSAMVQLKEHLQNTRNCIQKLRGDLRFHNNKFITNALSFNEENDCGSSDEKGSSESLNPYPQAQHLLRNSSSTSSTDYEDTFSDDSVEEIDSSIPTEITPNYCAFGQRYYYWSYYKHNWCHTEDVRWSIHKKYRNLKEEMVNNKLYRLNIETYRYIYHKASKLLQDSEELKSIKSEYTEIKLHYGVEDNLPLAISNVMSIIFYTDYDLLSYNLSKTFRKLTYFEENEYEMKQRNSEYWNWSKLLRETVECYGSMMTDLSTNVYYHCMNTIVFPSLNIHFCGPTSVTTKVEVITSFVYEHGIVVELQSYDDVASSLRIFNCSFLSCFGNEDERLLFGTDAKTPPLKIRSIYLMNLNENYKYFIVGIHLLEHVLNAQPFTAIKDDEMELEYKRGYLMIDILINNNEMDSLPKYMESLWREYCAKKKAIEINLGLFNTDHERFKELFVDTRTNNLIWIDFVCSIFNNCETIVIENNNRKLSSRYLSMLLLITETINKDENIKLISITIENVQMNEEQFDEFVQQFDDNHWSLKLKQSKTVQFGVWIDIANLSLNKLRHRKYIRNSDTTINTQVTDTDTDTDTETCTSYTNTRTTVTNVTQSVTKEVMETPLII